MAGKQIRVAFATCVQLGLSCIEEIYKIGGHLDLMITLKDEKAKHKSGRIYLDSIASEQDVPLLKINHINDLEVLQAIRDYHIDWLFIIGWSQIAGREILEAPTYGCIGMHPTLLPEGRGRAAVPWAILKGLNRTGVSMFKLDQGVDTGDILGQGVIEIGPRMTATELYQKVDEMHVELIRRYWKDIVDGSVKMKKQDHNKATEWPGRKPEDGRITADMTVEEAERLVRAVTHPYPGAFYDLGDARMIIWSADISRTDADHAVALKGGYLIPVEYEIIQKDS
ncbi:MAG: methionyl-tRNA formyltransferase [Lachnospiraceae bacterium]|nr:methionyl-tRNA formyltransferase [Lachnospiraceae bacterium]